MTFHAAQACSKGMECLACLCRNCMLALHIQRFQLGKTFMETADCTSSLAILFVETADCSDMYLGEYSEQARM